MTTFHLRVLNNTNCYWSNVLWEGSEERKDCMEEKRAKNKSRKEL